MTNAQLEELRKQAQEAIDAIAAEEERRKRLAELGGGGSIDIDLTRVEKDLDALVINGNNQVKLLERLNAVGDQTYNKLEELSLKLAEVMAVGMPLLNGLKGA